MITYDRLLLKGPFVLRELRNLDINIQANKHAVAVMDVLVEKQHKIREFMSLLNHHIIKIYYYEEGKNREGTNGERKTIFSGVIQKFRIAEEYDGYLIHLTVLSGTIALDRDLKYRSFQDTSFSYADIVETTAKALPHGAALCLAGQNRYPGKPIIQYAETNWNFIMRMAGMLNTAVYPEVQQSYPRLWLGIPDSNVDIEIKTSDYTYGISNRFYYLGGRNSEFEQSDFQYYEFDLDENYNIGDKVRFLQKKFIILNKRVRFRRSQIIFTYQIGREPFVMLKKTYNPIFNGMSILGEVLSTQGETLKLHLDIDESQNEAVAYPYEWTPDTGSAMYCMPKAGTKVSLYFCNEDERNARAVNCVRTNGSIGSTEIVNEEIVNTEIVNKRGKANNYASESSGSISGAKGVTVSEQSASDLSSNGMDNPNQKSLTTEFGKILSLNETSVELSSAEGILVKLEDGNEITFDSSKKIIIEAEGKVDVKAKRIVMETPLELKFVR